MRWTPPAITVFAVFALCLPTPTRARPSSAPSLPAHERRLPQRALRKPSLLVATQPPPPEAAFAVHSQRHVGQPRGRSTFRFIVAYALWLFLGMTGAHHLYLGRNKEAMLCSMTCGGFGLGWLSDVVKIPRFLRELAAAEAQLAAAMPDLGSARELEGGPGFSAADADAVAPARTGSSDLGTPSATADVEAPDGTAIAPSVAVDHAVHPTPIRTLGCFSGSCRLVFRIAWRMMLGMWLSLHVANLMPEALLATASAGMFRVAASAVIFAVLAQSTVALASSTVCETQTPPVPSPMAAASPISASAVAMRLGGVASSIRGALIHRPKTTCAILAAALLESRQATSTSGRGALPLIVAVLCYTLPTWREPLPTATPARSFSSAGLVVAASLLFWVLALVGALRKYDVALTVDGADSSINALRLLSCSLCAARPDRFVHMLRTLTEHACIKRRLETALGKSFDRLCILPQQINRCFDWDHAGTRWQRAGLSLAEAYRTLGLSRSASAKDVKLAHRKAALANHPDKVGAAPGSAAAEEAALAFMKAQKAYDRIMEARKPPAPKPKPAPPAPPKKESYYYGGSSGYRDTHSRKGRSSRGSSSRGSSSKTTNSRTGRSKPRKA